MSASTLLRDGRAMALVAGRRLAVLRRSRGIWGTAAYCAQSLRELPTRVNALLAEAAFDRRTGLETGRLVHVSDLGIDAGKAADAARNASGIAYMPSPVSFPSSILEELGLRYQDCSFVDLGSGMGRVVFLAAAFPFRKVVGVEFSPDLHRIAERNLAKLSGSLKAASVELVCRDAREYVFPSGDCVVYLFNPFGEAVMRTVLENLERSYRKAPADWHVIYYNPVLGAMLDEAPFLVRTRTTREYALYRGASNRNRP